MEVKPRQRLAVIAMQKQINQPAQAIEHLSFLHVLELQNNRFAKQISRLYAKQNDLPNAIHWAIEATYVDLYDASGHEMLADYYTQTGQVDKAAAARETVNRIRLWEAKRSTPAGEKP